MSTAPSTRAVRVLVADDDALVREAYRSFFRTTPTYTLVGEARNGNEAHDTYATLLPDVVLMDLQMPTCSGIEATSRICARWSNACVVALTTFGTREYIVAALRAGASGYLLKDTGAHNLVAGIEQAMRGDMPMSASVRRQLVDSVTSDNPVGRQPVDIGLTPRETELLGWLTQGLTNVQIGRQMYVSEGSVKQYLAHVGDKMGVKSRTQILVRAIQLNIVDPHSLPAVSEHMAAR
ncbi:response regulator [Propioniciclava soli]|uniref:Response regulator transcription factor n=1 Tax=Propioniciclava soli TaxID=2775081 RepID=A0ABZ3C7C1_9ACTN|nr:response regulator transcription factor [Propioniciclava soli]